MSRPVLAPLRRIFQAVAVTVVPEADALDAAQWAEVERIIEAMLVTRSSRVRRQLGLLLRAIETLPLVSTGRRFSALDPPRRTRFLETLQNSPVLLLRRGFWGLRTLVFMGYYGRPEAGAAIGYRADPRGWEARR